MDEITRLQILKKYADLAQQEIEAEEKKTKSVKRGEKMNNDITVGEWMQQEAAKKAAQEQAQQEAQRKAEEAQRMAAIPQSAQQAAMLEAYSLYKTRMAEEAQKTEAQRRTEELQTELTGLTEQLETYYKEPTKYAKELPAVEKRFNELWAEVDKLNPQPTIKHTNTVTFDNGSIY